MKVTGMNSADLVSSLYDFTTNGGKNKDSNSIEGLLSANITANNPAMARLANKSANKEHYVEALSAADRSDVLIRTLNDAKKSVFVKAADTEDPEELEAYQTQAVMDVAGLLNSYNAMVSGLADAGGRANKNFLSELNQLMEDYEEELEEFGISKCEDGTLALDAQVLADADLDAMADMFGPGANFAQELERQVTGIAEKTASTVDALQIYSTAYSNSGSYSQYEYLKGIYDIKA